MTEHDAEHDRPAAPQQPGVPGPTSYEERQRDIGSSLLVGGVVIIVLLGVLIWQGLF